jgi:TolB protein
LEIQTDMKSKAVLLTLAAAVVLLFALVFQGRAQQSPPPPSPPQAGERDQTPPAAGERDEVTLELRRNQRPLIRLAIPAFRGTQSLGGAAGAAARDLEQTVRRDLEVSGYFQIQGPAQLAAVPLTGDMARDMPQIRALGNEILLLGDLRAEGDRLVFEGRLFDLASGQSILAKRYRGAFPVATRIGHTFADEVIRYLTGARGLGLTTLAFSSDRTGGRKEIFLMDYDGANQRRITGHRSTSMSPAWGPKGDVIAYTSFFDGPPGLYLADLASGRKRPLVTSGSLNTSPSFAPDGGRVVFSRSLNGNVEIFTADLSGGSLRRLTHSNAIDTNPAWSPKGGEIAFTSGRAGNPHLYLMDSEGANQRRLTFDGTYNDGAAWSPEGDLLAYASRRGGQFQIAVTSIVTLATRVLTSGPGENESPTFSPDGRWIAFTSRRSGSKQIYVMDLAGGNQRQLTREGNNDMADWSRLAQ